MLRVRVRVVTGAEPAQSPPQPTNVEPADGTAVSTTSVSIGIVVEQFGPQSMPPGPDVTTPEPLPIFVTVITVGQFTAAAASTILNVEPGTAVCALPTIHA